jgi:uncharacterized protein (DUF1778 family)
MTTSKGSVAESGRLPYFWQMPQPLDTPKSSSTRPARLEARVSRRVHDLMKRAAKLQGRSVTDFVSMAIEAEARRVIEDETVLRLSLEDQKRFAKALLNPPKPNAALKRAFARHRKLIQPE